MVPALFSSLPNVLSDELSYRMLCLALHYKFVTSLPLLHQVNVTEQLKSCSLFCCRRYTCMDQQSFGQFPDLRALEVGMLFFVVQRDEVAPGIPLPGTTHLQHDGDVDGPNDLRVKIPCDLSGARHLFLDFCHSSAYDGHMRLER
ncbi:hypothetical protein EVAR_68448_1 [Eumeta japonica]|uniref:Uncharacterized protein n=1 Tax=Eumeta variegata TaxID=151549 RepID=A0A4C1SQ22_EUMVA|nr:hypothetical protein EVAR_68448_1 [Eumeta japonica]